MDSRLSVYYFDLVTKAEQNQSSTDLCNFSYQISEGILTLQFPPGKQQPAEEWKTDALAAV